MVGLELREIMGLAVAVDDLHIAHVSLDPLLGKLDRIEWAVRLRSKAYTVRGEPSYEVPRRLLHGAKYITSGRARPSRGRRSSHRRVVLAALAFALSPAFACEAILQDLA